MKGTRSENKRKKKRKKKKRDRKLKTEWMCETGYGDIDARRNMLEK